MARNFRFFFNFIW